MKPAYALISACLAFATVTAMAETVEVPVNRVMLKGITTIEMKVLSLNTDITGMSGDSLVMEAIDMPANGEVRSQRKGAHLKIWVNGSVGSGSLRCFFPKLVRLEINSLSGNVSLNDVVSKVIKVHTISGRIDLDGCAGVLSLESASGSISSERTSGAKNLRTMSGRIKVEGSEGDVIASTASGSQDFQDMRGNLHAVTTSGEIGIDGFNGTLHVENSTGSLSGEGLILTGDAFFKTVSGSIDMEIGNKAEELKFDLKSGFGGISAKGTYAEKTLVSGNGKILITGETISGSMSFE